MNKVQAILFDSDGVLVDTERLYFEATRTAFASAGAFISKEQWARWYLGESLPSSEIARKVGVPASCVDSIIAQRNDRFWNRIDAGTPIFPNVRETLKNLSRYFRLAVVTGATRPHFERVHASTGMGSFFDIIVTRDDCQKAKPHPHAYQVALGKLSLEPENCLAVEDSPRGAAAAVAAGVPCCIIPTMLTDMDLCPPGCKVLNHISQLPDMARQAG